MAVLKIIIISAIGIFLTSSVPAQNNANNQKFDAMIQKGIKDWQIPGLAAIVVKDGVVLFKKTYGIKDIETRERVDENTLFTMASTTKAIIAFSIGMLVDQGKINWEDKVRKHLPSFELSDPYITADARIKDLLTHNLGIGNADLLWFIDSVSTTETINRFRLAKKTYPLRGGFTYQNIMYAIAGEVVKAVSGKHWTTFVKENIFKRLEMNRTQAKSTDILQAGNYTTPHNNDLDDGVVKINHFFIDQVGSAGMIYSCASDISNYLTFLTKKGIFKGDTLIQPTTFNYIFKPHAIIHQEMYPTQQLVKPNWTTYGLGWFQQDYRGHKLDYHTGSLDGLVAIAGVLHDKNLAVYVFANLDHAELRHAIMYKALDLFGFNDNSRNWNQEVFDLYAGFKEENIKQLKERDKKRVLGTSPTLPLDEYLGTYSQEMLGSVTISKLGNKLSINSNNYYFTTLEHWHYDTFITSKDPQLGYRVLVNFNQNESGEIKDMEIFGKTFLKSDED